MNCVDNASPATGRAPVNSLRILQIRVHAGAVVDEPGTKMCSRSACVALVFGQLPRGDQRRHLDAESHERAAMLDKVARVRHAVALKVRPIRIFRIGPPVISFREEVVQSTRAAWT